MKLSRHSRFLPLVLSAIASAHAETVTRNDSANTLNSGTAWTGGVAPTNIDVATWDINSALTNVLGANLTWGGIDVSAAAGEVSISGTNTLAAGAVNLGAQSLSITTSTANGSLNLSSLTGTGVLTINNGTSNLGLTALNTANALNFNGTLRLRGGNATTSAGTTAGSFLYLGRSGITQAAGTAFALDTGIATNDAKDVIIDGDAWNGKTINLTSLSGVGSLRSDSGSAGTRSVRVDQSVNTTFSGLILSHASTGGLVRKLSFEKAGTGKLTLAGLVGKQTASAGGAAADVDLTVSGGTLALTANNTRTGTISVAGGATLEVGNGTDAGTLGTGSVTNNGSIVFNHGNSASVAIANSISGSGPITKDGNGTLSFTTANPLLSGNISLNAGSLRIGPHLGTGTLTAKAGTIISTGLASTIGASVVGGLTLEDGSESDFRLGAATDRIDVTNTGGFTVPGPGQTHTINLFNDPVAGGTITLIDYAGTALTNDEFNRFTLGITPFVGSFELVNNTANTSVDLKITLQNQIWKGFADGNWDSGTANWALESTPAVPAAFSLVNPALFDDSSNIQAVVIEEFGVNPLAVTFNNSTKDYTLTGGAITGTAILTKKGSGSVTLNQPNTYNGGTTVDGGTLRIGNGGTTGDIGSGAVTVAAGAALEFNRSNATPGTPDLDYKTSAKMRNVSGAGQVTLTGGLVFFNYTGSGTGFNDANSWNNFSGNLTIKGGSEFLTIRNGATAMGTGDIILGDATTSGALAQTEGNWTWTNDISLVGSDNRIRNRSATAPRSLKLQGVVQGAGGLTLEDLTGAMNDANRGFVLTNTNTLTGTLTIAAGTPLRVGGIPGNVDVSGAGLSADAFGTLGTATVVNNGTLTFSRTDAHTVSNAISGSGALRVGIPTGLGLGDTSTQVLTYTGSASHTGATTVNNGRLVVASGASLGGSTVTVAATATLGGSGTIAAPLSAAGTIAPGTSIGTLPVNGDTTVTGTLAIEVDGASADKLSVTGNLDLTGSTLAVTETGAGFTATSHVIAECSGTLSGLPSAPTGYAVNVVGNQLLLTKAGDDFDNWIGGFTFAPGADLTKAGDPDGDGLSNLDEYAFGLNPSNGSSVSPVTPPNKTAGTFTYTRRLPSLTQLDYAYESSTTLGAWGAFTPVSESSDNGNPVETITVTLPPSLLAQPKLFLRVSATE